ncbi:pyruvate ferredoxin oxidoreductase [Thermodesulfobacteriota bacterium]
MAGKVVAMTGNHAVANAMRQVNPDVCAAYPITPSTEVMQVFASFVADGAVDTNLVRVESEHSAMSACIGASAAGGRVMTATSSAGLALMWEMLYVASGSRLPIVLQCVNRALSAPINIHCDHSDSMGARDACWIQLYAENAQEAYDNMVQAVLIAENMDVRLPIMCCLDGFIISHSIEKMEILSDEDVKSFIGEYKPFYPMLDTDNPVTYGPIDLQNFYIEHKRQQVDGMAAAKDAVLDIGAKFGEKFGRKYGFFEEFMLDDAEIALVVMSSAAGTSKAVIKDLRAKGMKVGLLKPRMFRPFPAEEMRDALKHLKAICVLDRSDSFGSLGGPLFSEVRSAMYGLSDGPQIMGRIFGLGGRDLEIFHVEDLLKELDNVSKTGKIEKLVDYITVRV